MDKRMMSQGMIIALKYTKTAQDAEDVVQKACIKALNKVGQCTGDKEPWFRAIVRTTALNHHRSDKVHVPYEDAIIVESASVDETLYAELHKRLKLLDKKTYSMLVDKYFQGLSRTDIAKRYNVTPATVTNTCKRGIKELKRRLK